MAKSAPSSELRLRPGGFPAQVKPMGTLPYPVRIIGPVLHYEDDFDAAWPGPVDPDDEYQDVSVETSSRWYSTFGSGSTRPRRYFEGGSNNSGRIRSGKEGLLFNGKHAPPGAYSMRIQATLLEVQASNYGGLVFDDAGSPTHSNYSLRVFNLASDNVKLYQNGASTQLGVATITWDPPHKIVLTVVSTRGTPSDPGIGPYNLFVDIDGVRVIEVLNHNPGSSFLGRKFWAGLQWAGITYFDDFELDIYDFATSLSSGVVVPRAMPSPAPLLLPHEWSDGFELSTTYQVDVTKAGTGAEERRLLADRPVRAMTLRHQAMTKGEAWAAIQNLAYASEARLPMPLYCDQSVVTVASSGTDLYCTTDYRRFFPGARVAIFKKVGHTQSDVQYGTIDSVESDHLVLESSLTGTIPVGYYVVPMVDCEVVLDGGVALDTEDKGVLLLPCFETYGPSALLPTESDDPSGFSTWSDLPVFELEPNWKAIQTFGLRLEGRKQRLGRGEVVETSDGRAVFTSQLSLAGLTREDAWKIIRFFDSRMGRYADFWLPSTQTFFDLSLISTSYVDVVADGTLENFTDYFSYIGVVKKDGTVLVREIDSAVDNTSTWRFNVAEAFPSLSSSDIRRVVGVSRARFDKDSMTERWETTEVCSISLDILELISEQRVQLQ